MNACIASSPAKIILFGEHGVNRQQPALATAVDLRLRCRVVEGVDGYQLRSGPHAERGAMADLRRFKSHVDDLRANEAFDAIRSLARDFFATPRYVLAHVLERVPLPALEITWRSDLPVGSGMGSGAAASTAMVRAVAALGGVDLSGEALAWLAWQGDIIAHGGVASSLDSTTCVYGGLIGYSVADGVEQLPLSGALPLVIGDTQVEKSTAEANTRVRHWLEADTAHRQLFRDMGFLTRHAQQALAAGDLYSVGHLMNLHQLLQEKLGTGWPEGERLISAAIRAGAVGAKISGSGLGGIIIALAPPGGQQEVADAIDAAGGRSYVASAGADGTRLETVHEQEW